MKFLVALEPNPEVGGYDVTVPALPGCFTRGDTGEEALGNAGEATKCYLAMDAKERREEELPPAAEMAEVEVAT